MEDPMEDRVIIVSCDSHAGVPKELWPEYLPEQFHELLPQLHQDNDEIYPRAIYCIGAKAGGGRRPPGAPRGPARGLARSLRPGAAARRHGSRGHHRGARSTWATPASATCSTTSRAATTGSTPGTRARRAGTATAPTRSAARPSACSSPGRSARASTWTAQVAELDWMADHQFIGVYGPGYLRHADMPPLSDAYWDPFWAKCAERNLTVVVHAGFGTMRGHGVPAGREDLRRRRGRRRVQRARRDAPARRRGHRRVAACSSSTS